jgi:hypothetical protein
MSGERCAAAIYKRDTYRVSRGYGFKMHYERKRCSRAAAPGYEFCRQHEKLRASGVYVVRWELSSLPTPGDAS